MGFFSSIGDFFQDEVIDPIRSAGRSIEDEIFQPVLYDPVRSAGRSIDQEIFQPITDNADDFYKENIRPWMGEIGSVVGAMFGSPQLGGLLGGAFEEGGLSGGGSGGLGGLGGLGSFSDVSERQAKGYEDALNLAKGNQQYMRDAFAPFTGMGRSAIAPLKSEMGIGGKPYEDPMTQQIVDQQLKDIMQSKKASGMWSSGATPGHLADATLRTRVGMRDNRINNLMSMAQLGAGSTGQMAAADSRVTDSMMDASVGQAMALAAGDAVKADQFNQALGQAGDLLGGAVNTTGGILGDLFGGIGSLFGLGGGSGSGSSGSDGWNFDVFGSGNYGSSGYDIFDLGF